MRIPTSVAAFDQIVKGGVPAGSVIVLAGEPGAGNAEFAYTSAAKLSLARNDEFRRKFLFSEAGDIHIPQGTLYISFSKSKEDILRIVENTFEEDLASAFMDNLDFKDLSQEYFRNSIVPMRWVTKDVAGFIKKKGDILASFTEMLENGGDDRVIIVDSLTDLLTSPRINFENLVDVLRGLTRIAKKWNSVVYLLLTLGVVDKKEESIIFDTVDGVFIFHWSGAGRYSKRYRYMYVLKFVGLMAHLEEERIARFNTTLNRKEGFVVVNTEKIG